MTAAQVDLGMYEGRKVVMASVVIPNASGGLHDAMAVAPEVLHTGDKVTIAIECTVEDIIHKPIKRKGEDTGTYERVAKLHANSGMIVDPATVAKAFKEHRHQLEAAAGIQTIPGTDDL